MRRSRKSLGRAVIRFRWRDEVVARSERLTNRRARGQARAERRGRISAFQRRHRLLERLAIWIVAAGINEAARIAPIGRALESGRELNRC